MDAQKLKEEQLKLEKKLCKEPGGAERVKELRALCERGEVYELEFKIKELAKHKQAILSTKASDEELNAIKEKKSALEAPYNEQTRANDVKSRYIGLLLQEINHFEGEEYANEED